MASIYISMGNLKARAEGLAKDAQVYKTAGGAVGSNWVGGEELKQAADIIIKACNDAAKILERGQRAFNRQSSGK